MANLSVQQSTIDFIANEEKFWPTAYSDYKQWSVGYGSGTMPNGQRVKQGDTVTKAQALQMLKRDVQYFANHVNRLVTANLNQNQWDALVSFTYNLGEGNLASSTLLKVVNSTPTNNLRIKQELLKWVNAGGKVLGGLVKRREREANLYANGAVATNFFFWIVLVIAMVYLIKKRKRRK